MLYFFKGNLPVLLAENFETSNFHKQISLFVWKNSEKELGFETDKKGVNFVEKLLDKSCTLLLPDLTLLRGNNQVAKRINGFRGVTFLEGDAEILRAFDDYKTFELKSKKNKLLQRAGRAVTEVIKPTILDWYVAGKYTDEFMLFCKKKNLKYLFWSFSDFGIYFFFFDNCTFVNQKVGRVCEELECTMYSVDNISKMPFH